MITGFVSAVTAILGTMTGAEFTGSDSLQAGSFTLMTFNIRYGTAPDGENSWQYRKEALIDLIKSVSPDVLGVQEALAEQIDEIVDALPDYVAFGAGRDDGLRGGEHSSILYRKSRLGLLEGGTRWISSTPELPGSKGPGANLPRVFTWAELISNDGHRFLAVNAHLDHQSEAARALGTQQMLDFVKGRTRKAAVVMGDFNCSKGSKPTEVFDTSGILSASRPTSGPFVTFNGFNPSPGDGEMIDHIYLTSGWILREAIIDRRLTKSGRTPSDHYPVIAKVSLTP